MVTPFDNKHIYAYYSLMRRKQGVLIPIEVSVLEAALTLRGQGTEAAHGFLLAKVIQESTGARSLASHGTLYRALHRLERAGFLESFWEDPRLALEQGRPTRRFYKVTAAGENALAQAVAQHKKELTSLTPKKANP